MDNNMKPRDVSMPLDNRECKEAVLKCPICGSANTFITDVRVVGGIGPISPLTTHIDNTGIKVTQSDGCACFNGKRGVAVELTFSCEQGCGFLYSFGFHKGETIVQLMGKDKPTPEESNRSSERKDVIWRT